MLTITLLILLLFMDPMSAVGKVFSDSQNIRVLVVMGLIGDAFCIGMTYDIITRLITSKGGKCDCEDED